MKEGIRAIGTAASEAYLMAAGQWSPRPSTTFANRDLVHGYAPELFQGWRGANHMGSTGPGLRCPRSLRQFRWRCAVNSRSRIPNSVDADEDLTRREMTSALVPVRLPHHQTETLKLVITTFLFDIKFPFTSLNRLISSASGLG